MLTKKGKYGLKAMLALASLPDGEMAFAAEIALAERIPKKFLDTILLELRRSGLVRSRKGPAGGYALARRAEDISIGACMRVLDGPLAPISCASRTAFAPCQDCSDVAGCLVRRAMTEVRDAISDILDAQTLADLSRLEKNGLSTLRRPHLPVSD
ncbi:MULTISPECIES: Rrf2 family transcriptional regulator [unclassified Rhizobium]|uniref:RrF2 family transcriptional regulator n=1 Tax=unclassified Rhizobium TaxID=2613769 RepID=UPI0015FFCA92|nr:MULTISPECIES: Rrf2 family transcriptional regulator [unclassified Rhizobium]MBB1250987.1 Rrf2 family transcriptional regulator [Rhizobium sp. G21]MCV3767826.1 Rrf2 family transcriptional regulator [Rhizobium sp. TRM95796]